MLASVSRLALVATRRGGMAVATPARRSLATSSPLNGGGW